MTILKRRISVVFFVLLFCILSPVLIFYAMGNILGEDWNILATGGIFLRSIKSDSVLYLNEEHVSEINFFTRNYLFKNLKPDIYTILVKKNGYNDWTNKIKVYPNLVSESNVFMLPTKIESTEVKQYIITESNTTSTISKELKINPDYEVVKLLFEKEDKIKKSITLSSTSISELVGEYAETKNIYPVVSGHYLIWSKDNEIFIGWNGSVDSSPRIFCNEFDLGFHCQGLLGVYLFNSEVRNVGFFPGEAEVVIAAVENNIYAVEAEKNPDKKVQLLFEGKKPDFRILDNTIYVKDAGKYWQIEYI